MASGEPTAFAAHYSPLTRQPSSEKKSRAGKSRRAALVGRPHALLEIVRFPQPQLLERFPLRRGAECRNELVPESRAACLQRKRGDLRELSGHLLRRLAHLVLLDQ